MVLTYTIEKLPDEPVVLVTVTADYRVARDIPLSNAAGFALLETLTEPVVYINDIRALPSISLADIATTANLTTGTWDSIYRHPMIREVWFISTHPLIATASQSLMHLAHGQVVCQVFPDLDAALDMARCCSPGTPQSG